MKMLIITTITVLFLGTVLVAWSIYSGVETYKPMNSSVDFYSLSCKTLDGNDFQFDQLKGKRILIVNTASECGFTPQYKGLQKLHEMYSGDEFVILGFPCNDFGKQESGNAKQIEEFCTANFGVEFQMMEKVKVKGEEKHPVYVWLTSKEENGVSNHSIRWNFHKFAIDEQGNLVGSMRSGVKPLDKVITEFAAGKE
jgi:glutathione peroxidase